MWRRALCPRSRFMLNPKPKFQGGAAAVDTAFETCSEEECTVSMEDDRIELQRVTIQIPANEDISGEPPQRAPCRRVSL